MNPDDDFYGIPAPPPHRNSYSARHNSTVTPGVDNLGPSSVGGGISGIALGVANSHDRLSGIAAVRAMDHHDGFTGPAERGYHTTGSDNPYVPQATGYTSSESLRPEMSYGSHMALGASGATPGIQTPGQSSTHLSDSSANRRSMMDQHPGPYAGGGIVSDGPYQRQSQYSTGNLPGVINPDDIADDGEDEFMPASRNRASQGAPAAAGAAGGAVAGGFLGGMFGRNTHANPQYGPVPSGAGGLEAGAGAAQEKKALGGSMPGRKKRGLIVGLVLGLVILGAIVGGAVGGTLGSKHSEGSGSTDTASSDESTNGDLTKDSSEIKALMNNDNLHKVFPGMDYTPWGVQYPLCLKYPPSQNNVTRDMAVLSQLTNNVRLYGTDCNQTEMVLHAIDKLELTDMRVWLGVWIDSNDTTTTRQLNHLYDILDDTKHTSIFNGVIVGNEALYRAGSSKASAEKTLIGYINDVRDEVNKRNLDMTIATSDLGDNWNADMVEAVDAVMSNVHPFFAGVQVDVAAAWTWSFWQSHDVSLTKGTSKKQIISEVGWPSGGGKDCGDSPVCDSDTPGSVASIDNMNQFMNDWICQALENGTDYFWFEAFDEPWKVQYNTPGKAWEDKWGLMDAARKIKPGLKIPSCDGKTAS
ncbi:glucan endo-1-3-beta-glucosidase btgC [Penicillium macrosclerotiorum]|uniref:glucan endo-1-3-beta-glucosidase btgC n=1 Tax=Penicillium macrosclerotiorum TaxID=303699 RepID=UPI0025487124|nr:glucan endo-1-3-beta-glucosidase btgC [Penicillium macrosclerotiorum]KAJ5689514.1 glucan endo-1-3-beta-glucosidase btgC [Penicillium macrosclerotiorum]